MRLLDDLIAAIRHLFISPVDDPEHSPMDKLTREEVRAKLADLAQHRGGGLDTRSIVDVQKLLNKDSDFEARRTLWAEFEQPGTYTGSLAQNIKLLDKVIDAAVDGDVTIPKE